MLQFLANGLCNAGVYSLVAVGFGMILFAARTFHIAHGAVYTTSAYACYAALTLGGMPLALALIVGAAAGIVTGVLCERLVYYPLITPRRTSKASPTVIMISSLGAYIVIVNLLALTFGNDTKILRPGVESTISMDTVILTRIQITQVLVAGVCLLILWLALKSTNFGRTLRALADDDELVGVLGYNVRVLRTCVFAVGSVLAAIGAMLSALDVGITPHAGFEVVLIAAVATIIGGRGRFLAPVLGSVTLAVLQSVVAWRTSQKWTNLVVFGILILFLLLRPEGLLASRKRAEEA